MIRIVRCCYNHPHLKFFLQAEICSFTMIQLRSFTIIQLRQNGALASNILFTNRNMAHAETNMFIQYDPTRQNGNNQQLTSKLFLERWEWHVLFGRHVTDYCPKNIINTVQKNMHDLGIFWATVTQYSGRWWKVMQSIHKASLSMVTKNP